jgi:hypothetical protein
LYAGRTTINIAKKKFDGAKHDQNIKRETSAGSQSMQGPFSSSPALQLSTDSLYGLTTRNTPYTVVKNAISHNFVYEDRAMCRPIDIGFLLIAQTAFSSLAAALKLSHRYLPVE